MISNYYHPAGIRTDLALEAKDALTHTPEQEQGVIVEESAPGKHLKKTIVKILTENAAAKIGKPKGTYVTFESPLLAQTEEGIHEDIADVLAESLLEFCCLAPNYQHPENILVVGLGNRNVTPDCLGPFCVDHLAVSRHLFLEYGQAAFSEPAGYLLSGIVPGVMGQTGMESLEIIQGIVSCVKPGMLLIVDSLAARSIKRLNRTIQISDTGIHPGSGVGNHRQKLCAETLGIPVISLGIPTVVDAATIVTDSLLSQNPAPEDFDKKLAPALRTMFVTPKDVDDTILRLSYTVSESINKAFGPHIR